MKIVLMHKYTPTASFHIDEFTGDITSRLEILDEKHLCIQVQHINILMEVTFNSKRFGREMVYFDLLMGQTYVREAILAGKSAKGISAMWQEDVRRFKEQRRPYLLYAE